MTVVVLVYRFEETDVAAAFAVDAAGRRVGEQPVFSYVTQEDSISKAVALAANESDRDEREAQPPVAVIWREGEEDDT